MTVFRRSNSEVFRRKTIDSEEEIGVDSVETIEDVAVVEEAEAVDTEISDIGILKE